MRKSYRRLSPLWVSFNSQISSASLLWRITVVNGDECQWRLRPTRRRVASRRDRQ